MEIEIFIKLKYFKGNVRRLKKKQNQIELSFGDMNQEMD